MAKVVTTKFLSRQSNSGRSVLNPSQRWLPPSHNVEHATRHSFTTEKPHTGVWGHLSSCVSPVFYGGPNEAKITATGRINPSTREGGDASWRDHQPPLEPHSPPSPPRSFKHTSTNVPDRASALDGAADRNSWKKTISKIYSGIKKS